jgi:predicted tellurium resistance membrane protein TerC
MQRVNETTIIDSSIVSIAVVTMDGMDSIKYVQRLLQRFGVLYMAIVIILGFIGNSMSCYVFVRSKLK